MIKKATDVLNEMYKEAKTRVQKEIDAGRITDTTMLDKIYALKRPENNLQNRINAKAKRMESGNWKAPTSVKDYNKMSNPDNLKSIAAIDQRRQTKDMGHHVGKVISKLKEIGENVTGINPEFYNTKDDFNGNWRGKGAVQTRRYQGDGKGDIDKASTRTFFGDDGKNAYRFSFPNPKAKVTAPNLSKETRDIVSKEERAYGVLHEVLGEGKQRAIQSHIANKFGLNNNVVADAFEMGSHASPLVLAEDAKRMKRFSPFTQQKEYVDRSSKESAKHYYAGEDTQNSMMKILRKQGKAQKSKGLVDFENLPFLTKKDRVKHLLSKYKTEIRRPTTPWFEYSLPDQKEKRRMLMNIMHHNRYKMSQPAREAVREYAKTNFWDLK